jgi:hypothetical protein
MAEADARAQAAAAQRAGCRFTPGRWAMATHYRDRARLEQKLDALRRAGFLDERLPAV